MPIAASAVRPEPPLSCWGESVSSVLVTRRLAESYVERPLLHTANSTPAPEWADAAGKFDVREVIRYQPLRWDVAVAKPQAQFLSWQGSQARCL